MRQAILTADLVNEPAFDKSIDIHDSYLAKQHPGEDGNSAFLDSIIVPVGDLGVLQVMKSPLTCKQWYFDLIGCAGAAQHRVPSAKGEG